MKMKEMIDQYKVSLSILVFLLVVNIFHFYLKPEFVYNADGTFKQFGLGYKQKTVIPMWVVCICFAILSYLSILWWKLRTTI